MWLKSATVPAAVMPVCIYMQSWPQANNATVRCKANGKAAWAGTSQKTCLTGIITAFGINAIAFLPVTYFLLA